MGLKFGKYREVDSRYLNVPVKYILNYNGANEDGKVKYGFKPYEEWVKDVKKFNEKFSLETKMDYSIETYNYLKKNGYISEVLLNDPKDKTLCIIDFYGKDKALVAWRNNKTCKMGMTRICKLEWKDKKLYLKYKDKLILLSNSSGWVL